jgi:hypothetical protein
MSVHSHLRTHIQLLIDTNASSELKENNSVSYSIHRISENVNVHGRKIKLMLDAVTKIPKVSIDTLIGVRSSTIIITFRFAETDLPEIEPIEIHSSKPNKKEN